MLKSDKADVSKWYRMSRDRRVFDTCEAFYDYLQSCFPSAEQYVNAQSNNCAVLTYHKGLCRLAYNAEIVPQQIDDVFAQAINAGHTSVGDCLLVDYRCYTGIVDWKYVSHRRNVATGMQQQPRKIAYVMHDEHALLTAKGFQFWLQQYECQVFLSAENAEAWLGWNGIP